MKNDCIEINTILEVIEKSKKFVIIYTNKDDEETWYGVSKFNTNMIGQINDIFPMPSINMIRLFSEDEAIEYNENLPKIRNGNMVQYFGNIVPYESYLYLIRRYKTECLDSLEKTLKRNSIIV